ncbi:hypothetical protein V2J09_010016 [Rumex salicifolius]
MKPRINVRTKSQKSENVKGDGPNWMVVAGSALLSSLFIHLGYKLKQALESRKPDSATLKGTEGMPMNHPNGQIITEPEASLSLVTIAAPEYSRENGVVWTSSPDRLELPPRPFHHSNCSDSPCASDSGSDIFSKREVIQKLRQQLKRRDEMILEMQDQIVELQNALNRQASHSNHLQSQLDATNRDLFDSEREIQKLRKAIADHCVGKNLPETTLPSEENSHVNRYNGDCNNKNSDKSNGEVDKIDMLKKEIGELKEVIEGKEFLVQSYKEQKLELSIKIRELQQRLDSQVPNIL